MIKGCKEGSEHIIIKNKINKLFRETQENWKDYDKKLIKKLPDPYHLLIDIVGLGKFGLYGLAANIKIKMKLPGYEGGFTIFLCKEIADDVLTDADINPDKHKKSIHKNFDEIVIEQVLLHEANHLSSAFIIEQRNAKNIFTEAVTDYITNLELANKYDKEPKLGNWLTTFIHTLIKCSKNDDEEVLKAIFNYQFNTKNNPDTAQKYLAKGLCVDIGVIKNFECAGHFNDIKECAKKSFDNFDEVFKEYSVRPKQQTKK